MDFNLLFTASFFIFGLNYALGSPTISDKGDLRVFPAIGSGITTWLFINWKWSKDIFMPMFLCVTCMASFWGSIIYFSFNSIAFTVDFFSEWILFIIVLSGLNRLLKSYL